MYPDYTVCPLGALHHHVTAGILRRHWPYIVTQKLPQIYTANHATFPIRIRKMTVQIAVTSGSPSPYIQIKRARDV